MKKILVVVLALVASFGIAIPAQAATGETPMDGRAQQGIRMIILHDHTDKSWPVKQATDAWVAAMRGYGIKGIALGYTSQRTCPYGPGVACVDVTQYNGCNPKKPNCDAGYARRLFYIKVNNGVPAAERLVVVEHEIGHILGLGHSRYPSSLMFPVSHIGRTPQWSELAPLKRTYG